MEDTSLCEIIHPEIVDDVRGKMPDASDLEAMANLLRIFGDGTRIKIISALSIRELCVCDIAGLLGMSKSAISHQLRVLRHTKLVKFRRDGRHNFYSLDDEHVEQILKMALSHVRGECEDQ